jgi:hypothetical protein
MPEREGVPAVEPAEVDAPAFGRRPFDDHGAAFTEASVVMRIAISSLTIGT